MRRSLCLPEVVLESWSTFPTLLISVIFATLFLGKRIPSLKDIWLVAGPQVSFGQTVAWGQYVFGLLLALSILTPFFGINPMAGALIEIGFEGGHGTSVYKALLLIS
jgi:ESS family glutamate:Na+ symporter